MKPVARAAVGQRKIVARRAEGAMTAKEFAERFNAKPIGAIGNDTNPFSLWQIGRELEKVLVSKGGRPSLDGADSQMKVSLLDVDIPVINEIVKEVAVGKYKPSPSQVVAVLLHMAVTQFSKEEIGRSVREAM